jgi:carboxylesterase type B
MYDMFFSVVLMNHFHCNSFHFSSSIQQKIINRHMEDAVAAVSWVIKHASRLGGDPRGIFVSGHSAGGNIAGK